MRPDAIVCHPGPINRGVEFDSYMPDHPERSVILDQVYAGICVRMAALYLLLGGADNAIVCHPGPINRGVEFDSYMPDHPERSVILDQVYAGICVRMAALYLLLGGADNGLAS